MNVSDQITFKRRSYTVSEVLPVTPLLAGEGMTAQAVIVGKNGATYLLQTFEDGVRHAISTSGAKVTEFPAAA